MRAKKVWRYWCDFCKKGGCHKGHMAKHETRCTKNPKRFCGVCKESRGLPKIVAEFSSKASFRVFDEDGARCADHEKNVAAVKWLRSEVEHCPACILAVFRQSDFHDGYELFSFKEEMKELWEERKAWRDEEESYRHHPATYE